MKKPQSEEETEEFNTFADQLEREWRQLLPRYTDKELVEIFSPPKKMILEKIKGYEVAQQEHTQEIKLRLKALYALKLDEFSCWFGEQLVKLDLAPTLDKYIKHIMRLKRILQIISPKTQKNIRQNEVETARQYPIYEMARSRLELRKCGDKFSSLCPFHEEKRASFYIYPETNTYHCFGCQANGDIINLTMHLYGTSFPEAIKMLQQ